MFTIILNKKFLNDFLDKKYNVFFYDDNYVEKSGYIQTIDNENNCVNIKSSDNEIFQNIKIKDIIKFKNSDIHNLHSIVNSVLVYIKDKPIDIHVLNILIQRKCCVFIDIPQKNIFHLPCTIVALDNSIDTHGKIHILVKLHNNSSSTIYKFPLDSIQQYIIPYYIEYLLYSIINNGVVEIDIDKNKKK